MSDIQCRIEGCAGRMTLNRPKALNALNDTLVKTLLKRLRELDNDSSVHAIVITGSQKVFHNSAV